MSVLVANPGSSSLKLSIVGNDDAVHEHDDGPHQDASASARLADRLERHPEIRAVGVRVVHGGSRFRAATVVDAEVGMALAALDELAPLHNPPARALIDGLRREHPAMPVIACFDTAFHTTLPPAAHTYALPRAWREDLGVRRYGFHGLSYEYLMGELERQAGAGVARGKVILAHLGAGSSLAAVENGRSMDTTMGFTPTGGLMMATRTGDLDPGVLLHILRTEGLTVDQLDHLVNRESGLLGVSETTADMRDIVAKRGADPRAKEAIDLYVYSVQKGIASMAAAINGVETLVFAGGIGEHSPEVRAEILDRLGFLGIRVDKAANEANAPIISAEGSPCTVRVIATDEEMTIARIVCEERYKTGKPSRTQIPLSSRVPTRPC